MKAKVSHFPGTRFHKGNPTKCHGKGSGRRVLADGREIAAGKALSQVYRSISVRGYTHQTLGGFLNLRPARYSAGQGQALFRHFCYQRLE